MGHYAYLSGLHLEMKGVVPISWYALISPNGDDPNIGKFRMQTGKKRIEGLIEAATKHRYEYPLTYLFFTYWEDIVRRIGDDSGIGYLDVTDLAMAGANYDLQSFGRYFKNLRAEMKKGGCSLSHILGNFRLDPNYLVYHITGMEYMEDMSHIDNTFFGMTGIEFINMIESSGEKYYSKTLEFTEHCMNEYCSVFIDGEDSYSHVLPILINDDRVLINMYKFNEKLRKQSENSKDEMFVANETEYKLDDIVSFRLKYLKKYDDELLLEYLRSEPSPEFIPLLIKHTSGPNSLKFLIDNYEDYYWEIHQQIERLANHYNKLNLRKLMQDIVNIMHTDYRIYYEMKQKHDKAELTDLLPQLIDRVGNLFLIQFHKNHYRVYNPKIKTVNRSILCKLTNHPYLLERMSSLNIEYDKQHQKDYFDLFREISDQNMLYLNYDKYSKTSRSRLKTNNFNYLLYKFDNSTIAFNLFIIELSYELSYYKPKLTLIRLFAKHIHDPMLSEFLVQILLSDTDHPSSKIIDEFWMSITSSELAIKCYEQTSSKKFIYLIKDQEYLLDIIHNQNDAAKISAIRNLTVEKELKILLLTQTGSVRDAVKKRLLELE